MSHRPFTKRVFIKLLGLFVLLLVFHTLVMEFVFSRLMQQTPDARLPILGRQALLSGLIALAVALPIAAWVAGTVTVRLRRMVQFARCIADGDLNARLQVHGEDELSATEEALNQTAERLSENFAELESRRQELAAMLDSMQEAVVAITAAGLVRWSNEVMQGIAGMQIRPGRPLIHAIRDPELLACVKGALEKREVRNGRVQTLAPGRVYEISAVPLPSGGALAVLHDVTRIEAAEKSRRDFIANVSHELRTPLTSIQGYVETLIDDPKPNEQMASEFLNIILKNATRMCRLTEDLLALATVESPDYLMKPRRVAADVMVREALNALGGMVVDLDVKVEFAGGPDAQVLADSDSMNQIFGNLVENALKYARESREIRVGARLLETEVEFRVQDFGPGIASEHLERIFERFYRVDKARSRESGGTGLGLAIVRHLVEAQGGRIWAESELGQGTTFCFTLPVARELSREEAEAKADEEL